MQQITERDGVHKQWSEMANGITLDTLPGFLKHLTEDYRHEYGTIVHAIAAGMQATLTAMNNSPQGGITGFQAGCLMWEVIEKCFHEKGPMRLVKYDDLLYPQHERSFTAISKETRDYVRQKAEENLGADITHVAPRVVEHWRSIARGAVPFGLRVEGE